VVIPDAGNIGSASDTDAIAISSGGVVNFTQTPTLSDKRLTNTPAFKVTLSGNQTIANDTLTRVTFDTESYDTDNAFASNIFTVPTGQGGTYAFSYLLFVDDIDDTDFCFAYIEVDGAQTLGTQDQRYGSSGTQNQTLQSSGVLTLTAGQTVEVVVKHGEGANQVLRNSHTCFQMYKLIGI